MTFYFESLVDFVGAHPQLSLLAVFLLALLMRPHWVVQV